MAGSPCLQCGEERPACRCPRCPHCGELRADCYQKVDERFPARAVEAYKDAGYEFAATCPKGQAHDTRQTRGWCWDRARFDKYWKGAAMTDEERRGFKPAETLG